MMARVRETLARPLVVSWALVWGAIVFAGSVLAAGLRLSYVIGVWQSATEVSVADLRKAADTLKLEQSASRARGDILRAQVAGQAGDINALRAALASQTDLLNEIRGDVKRLMERRFSASEPGPVWASPGVLNQRAGTPR